MADTLFSHAGTTYDDLGYTNYPDKVDKRSGTTTDSEAVNPYLAVNTDFVPGAPAADANYVKASDITALQDSVIAIQRVLGKNPHILATAEAPATPNTVGKRIADIEASLSGFNVAALDLRYGGTTFSSLTPNQPTIISHHHTGAVNGNSQLIAPDKINLATEVKGLLGKSYIQLDPSAGGFSAADIRMGPASAAGDTISAKFTNVVFKNVDNTITGDTIFSGTVKTNCYAEINGNEMTGVSKTSDTGTFVSECGYTTTTTVSAKSLLRYGSYAVMVRMKVSSNASSSTIFTLNLQGAVSTGGATTYLTQAVKGTDFDASNTYQTMYWHCDHKAIANGTKELNVQIVPAAGAPTISIDSIVIMPVGVAAWSN